MYNINNEAQTNWQFKIIIIYVYNMLVYLSYKETQARERLSKPVSSVSS